MIGKAALAGVVPNLQYLCIDHCHASQPHMADLIKAIAGGFLYRLQWLSWDGLSAGNNSTTVSNSMLGAFAQGKCPEITFISFIDNTGFRQESLSNLTSGLNACPKLGEVRMDTTMEPWDQLDDLSAMLVEGGVPSLVFLTIRIPSNQRYMIIESREDLEKAGSSRGLPADRLTIRFGRVPYIKPWFHL